MKTSFSPRRALALVALALLAAAAPASATSYVRMSDEALADSASIVAEVRVVAVESSPARGTPSTDYLVQIERMLKGDTGGSTVVVRVDGGVRPDGIGLRIFGAPRFKEGSRAVLFLEERKDGTYGIYNMMLGAFHELTAGGRRVAMRNLGEATEVIKRQDGSIELAPGADRPRDLDRFAAWVQDRARDVRRPADYFVELGPQGLQQAHEKFTHLSDTNADDPDATNLPLRWFLFDNNSNAAITFRAHSTPQPAVPDVYSAFQAALNLWTSDSTTPIRYLYGGQTSASGGLAEFDNVNTILFNDPNDEISAFRCEGSNGGGVIAKGGPWFDRGLTGRFKGTSYIETQGADIVVNNGIDCFFQNSQNPQKAAEELFAHELGHTLGFGHSSENTREPNATLKDALMYAFVHDDGRGARINSDDRAALAKIYGAGSSTAPPGKCKADATTLCLMKKRFRVQVEWQNQFDGSSGVGRAIPRTDFTGFFSFGDPSNVELLIKVLDFGDVIKVFYGQLTNLNFTITVTDTNTGEVKTYTNTSGNCGGIDNGAFPSAQAVFAKKGRASASAAARAQRPADKCKGDKDTLCLNGRFAVEVDWHNPGNGEGGKANSVSLSRVTGTFYFTDPGNLELMTKMLDFGDRFVFFYGTLSNLEYTIRVTDMETGVVKTYQNPAGTFCGGLDNNAF